uniref:Uncharacterized protein n=1 Tax=Arundo donax TaxID=35708 RepID=A0A0A9G6F7_ARUDO
MKHTDTQIRYYQPHPHQPKRSVQIQSLHADPTTTTAA